INRSGVMFINPKDYGDSIEQRMLIYRDQAGDLPIKAYINVGGGTTSVGTRVGKKAYKPGLNRALPAGADGTDSIITRFILDGIPVIHLVKIQELAQHYGLSNQPATAPPIGEGQIYFRDQTNLWLAGGLLFGILAALYAFVRSDWGIRFFIKST